MTDRQVSDLLKVAYRMSNSLLDHGVLEAWLYSEQPLLDQYRPIDLIRDGHTARVMAMVDKMEGSEHA